jgi:hypothetical protein
LTSGGVILSLAYLLVLQAVLASMAHGAMAAWPPGSLFVICTSDGPVRRDVTSPGEGGAGEPADGMLRWHCARHCQAAGTGPTISGPVADAIHVPAPAAGNIAVPAAIPSRPAFHGSLADARAPPSSI